MSLAMTQEEREKFLSRVHIGVLSIPENGRGPLAAPIWCAFDRGADLRFVTDARSRKGRLLDKVDRISLLAQTEIPRYKYVSVEGPIVSIEPADVDHDLRPLAYRYLGREMGDYHVAECRADRERNGIVLDRRTPERWLSVDTVDHREPHECGPKIDGCATVGVSHTPVPALTGMVAPKSRGADR